MLKYIPLDKISQSASADGDGKVTLPPFIIKGAGLGTKAETPSVDAQQPHTADDVNATFDSLLPKDLEKFTNLRISDGWVKRAQIKRMTSIEAHVEVGISFNDFTGDLSGLLIPYLAPSDGALITVRLKRDNPEVEDGKKQNKYRSPLGKVKPLYFVPGVNYAGSEAGIVLVESELSAITVAALGERIGVTIRPIATGGCNGWVTQVKGPNGEKLYSIPLPDLDMCIGQKVTIMFDSDAASNPDVRLARAKLAWLLASDRYKAAVRISTVPQIEEKSGPDDLIAQKGDEAFVSVLDKAGTQEEVAVADAKAAIEAVNKTSPDLAKAMHNAADAIAYVSDKCQREILANHLATAVHGALHKETVINEIASCMNSWEQKKADFAQRLQEALATGLSPDNFGVLLGDLRDHVRRFVVLSTTQASIIAVFVAYTYVWKLFEVAPYIHVTSAEKRSGKTRVLEVLEDIVGNPWYTMRTTAAALVRKLHSDSPVLLLDENDQAFKGHKDYAAALTQVLNAGHRKGGKATLCVGKGSDIQTADFDIFGPKVLAGIGKLPDTVADRSIVMALQRKTPSEKVERFRRRLVAKEAVLIRERLKNWVTPELKNQLIAAWPVLPNALSDRQQDVAEPLLAVADYAGPAWGDITRASLVELFGSTASEDDSLSVRLLTDIRSVFTDANTGRIPSKNLIPLLLAIETSPWPASEQIGRASCR